jgi:hypothetical protein
LKSALIPFLLGVVLVGGAVAIHRQQQAIQRADLRDIAGLRAELASERAALTSAPAGSDSARLAPSVAARTYLLGRREFHVPSRQENIDRWWTLSGPGTMLTLVGGILLALAAGAHIRARRRTQLGS